MTRQKPRSRVCMMTSSHPVDYSRFYHREAMSLARAGYEVTLIGLTANPASDRVPDPGLRLIPVSGKCGLAKRHTVAEIARLAREQQAVLYHCLDPWTLGIGLEIARQQPGSKVVYDSTELFPAVYAEREDLFWPVRRALAARVRRLEAAAARQADAIIETNSTRAERFRKMGVEPVLVPNYPEVDVLPEPAIEREPLIAYTGLLTRHRGFDKLLQAFAIVASDFPEAGLLVAGSFDPRTGLESWTRSYLDHARLSHKVRLLGWLPYEEMFRRIRECSAGVILLQPGRTNDYTGQPNKLFEFMGAGIPVVASDFPEIAPIIRKAGCGWLCDPTDVKAVASALRTALTDRSENRKRGEAGRHAVLARYNWAESERSLVGLYRRLLG